MVFTDEDNDIKLYKKYSEEDIEKYINLYLKEKKLGINFDALIRMCRMDINKKKHFLKTLRTNPELHKIIDINDVIDDYTSHLLLSFFMLNSSNEMFSYVERNFIQEYVRNESEIEGIDEKSEEGKMIREGLEVMYRFLHSKENNSTTGSIMLTDLHEQLFSLVEYGKYARQLRTDVRFFPGTGIELEDPYLIPRALRQSDRLFDELYEDAEKMANSDVEERMFMVNPFLEKLMKYKVEIIRIHPFSDGNKRSTRGIVNYLLERAGLPPVYVKINEHDKYQEALVDAMKNNKYQTMINFYKNKLCDSIEELVVNPFAYAIDKYHEDKIREEEKRQKGSNLIRVLKNNDLNS